MSIQFPSFPLAFIRWLLVSRQYNLSRIISLVMWGAGEFAGLWFVVPRFPQEPARTAVVFSLLFVASLFLFGALRAIDVEERGDCERDAAECWYRRRTTGVQRGEMDDPDPAFIRAYCFSAENARLLEAGLPINRVMNGNYPS